MKARPLEKIHIDELLKYGVWEYDLSEENYSEEQDETWIVPVLDTPVSTLDNRIIVTKVKLADGTICNAILSNVALNNIASTQQFLFLEIECKNKWCFLQRYFDSSYEDYGPDKLCKQLNKSIEEVFPIEYDITNLTTGLLETRRNRYLLNLLSD